MKSAAVTVARRCLAELGVPVWGGQITHRTTRFGGPPGNPAAFFELDHVVLPDGAIVGQRHREHLTRAAHALPGGCAGQIVVPVPARLLSWVRDQLEDPLRPGRDLAARADHARLLLRSCHAPIQTPGYAGPAAMQAPLGDSDLDWAAIENAAGAETSGPTAHPYEA